MILQILFTKIEKYQLRASATLDVNMQKKTWVGDGSLVHMWIKILQSGSNQDLTPHQLEVVTADAYAIQASESLSCSHYWYLNEHTIKNAYPLPLITELLDKLKGARRFTKLDTVVFRPIVHVTHHKGS